MHMGMAETANGLARKMVSSFEIGGHYTLSDLASVLGVDVQSLGRKGVVSRASSDSLILLINLQKNENATQYIDHLDGSTLFWEGQNKNKFSERYINDGKHDVFVFIRDVIKTPYTYVGRGVPIRQQIIWEPGIPSKIVFELYEYDAISQSKRIRNRESVMETEPLFVPETSRVALTTIRTKQSEYRKKALELWGNSCAVTAVDDSSWLIASHIKPWKESNNDERIDPFNSLVLTPNYDKLFDRGVITFSPESGKIILPDNQSKEMWQNFNRLHIDEGQKLIKLPQKTSEYLAYHNNFVFNFRINDNLSDEEYLESLICH